MSLHHNFHTEMAQLFIEDLMYRRANYFYFLGKTTPWGMTDIPPSTFVDSSQSELEIRDNISYAIKIALNDVSIVCKNYTWTSGLVYDMWDHTKSMLNKKFYVMTSAYRVYKCLDNSGQSSSTVEPTGTSTSPIRTSDGYLWKYMYTIPVFKRSKFISGSYIPVQKAISDSFYNDGAVDAVSVTSGGSGYTNTQATAITLIGGVLTGSGASAVVSAVSGTGAITGITINNAGSGYTKGARFSIISTNGYGASITYTVNGSGQFTDISASVGGSGYSIGDIINITVGGAVLTPVVSRDTGAIIDVHITDMGYGYATAPTISLSGGGTGAYNNPTAVIKAFVSNGSIVNVTIEDPGIGYSPNNSTTISVQGDGEGASFTPVVVNGKVVDVIIESRGVGYSTISLTVNGSGSGATVVGYVGGSDFNSDQSVIEQSAIQGAIYAAVVTNVGSGYSATPVVTITGDGTGATATATVVNGAITKIVVTSYGSGYTYANLNITDSTGTGATAYCVYQPTGGHGTNAVSELDAKSVVFSALLNEPLENISSTTAFRQFGVMKNPYVVNGTSLFEKQKEVTLTALTFANVSNMSLFTVIVKDNVEFVVVSIVGNIVSLQTSKNVTPTTGTYHLKTDVNTQFVCTAITSVSTFNKYSGNILYSESVAPFSYNKEQIVGLRTLITL